MEACEPPQRLLLTMALSQPGEDVIEVRLTADGSQTILVWEERGHALIGAVHFADQARRLIVERTPRL